MFSIIEFLLYLIETNKKYHGHEPVTAVPVSHAIVPATVSAVSPALVSLLSLCQHNLFKCNNMMAFITVVI